MKFLFFVSMILFSFTSNATDLFNRGVCSNTPVTVARLLALIPTGFNELSFGKQVAIVQTRKCSKATGCTRWVDAHLTSSIPFQGTYIVPGGSILRKVDLTVQNTGKLSLKANSNSAVTMSFEFDQLQSSYAKNSAQIRCIQWLRDPTPGRDYKNEKYIDQTSCGTQYKYYPKNYTGTSKENFYWPDDGTMYFPNSSSLKNPTSVFSDYSVVIEAEDFELGEGCIAFRSSDGIKIGGNLVPQEIRIAVMATF